MPRGAPRGMKIEQSRTYLGTGQAQSLTQGLHGLTISFLKKRGFPFLETCFRRRRMLIIPQSRLYGIEGYPMALTVKSVESVPKINFRTKCLIPIIS